MILFRKASGKLDWFNIAIAASVAVTFLVSLLATFVLVLIQPDTAPAPLAYDKDVYQAEETNLCVGDELVYSVVISVNTDEEVVKTILTIFNVDRGFTAQFDESQRKTILFGPSQIARTRRFTIPELPPANYELRVAAQPANRDVDAYRVPFTIIDDCP